LTAAIGLPAPRSAATASLFRPGGDPYSLLPDPAFDLLPGLLPERVRKAILNALPRVYRFLVKLAQAGELNELVTDQRIAQAAGCSERIVQYVLNALDVIAGEGGFPFIRRTPSHGRRFIEFIRGFLPSGSRPTAVPPAPPSKTFETTTTREGGSSSLRSAPENAEEGREVAPQELVDRACRLIPGENGATPGKVADVFGKYGADWVSRALDIVEKRNKKSGAKKVWSWGHVLGILKNFANEDGPAPIDPPPAPPPVKAKVEPPKEEPPSRLTAEEVAELVERCQSRKPMEAKFARVQLRLALDQGGIPAELEATIPTDLKEPVKPRGP
jgi:hypothetical protein